MCSAVSLSHSIFSARANLPADTVRAFKERNKLGRFNPENAAKAAEIVRKHKGTYPHRYS
jgi:hypothetical protein